MADNALKKRNALADLGQGVSRGFWADGMGGPVDMLTTLANLGIAGGGYAGHKLGLLSQPPELIQNPTGGSEWIAQKMRSAGLLKDNPGSTADNYGRVAGGLLAPLTAARAPQIANALQQAPAALQRGAYAVGEKGADMAGNHLQRIGAQPAMLDVDGVLSKLKQHQTKLDAEAADWATRKYKGNERAVFFEGDGPGPESMKIGSINAGRRNKNVQSRMDQMAEIDSVMEMVNRNPAKVEAAYIKAIELAQHDAKARGWPLDETLDAYVGKAFTGTQDHISGPGSIGRQLRMAIEGGIVKQKAPAIQPASSGGDDFLAQLFGGG